jgi:putative hemolysin
LFATFLIVVGVSLAVSFICSILEAVLLSVSQSYVALLRRRGDRAGELLASFREKLDEPIAAILTLNTIAHTVGAAMGGALALQLFGNRWVAVFSAVLTFAVLVFSEIIPKTIGARHWRLLARPVAHVLRVLLFVLRPVLLPLSWLSRLLTGRGERAPAISRGELEVLAELGRREGTLKHYEWEVLRNVINLHRLKVASIMTPRTEMVAIAGTATLAEAKAMMLGEGVSRVPVYEGTPDRVIGILRLRDVVRAERRGVSELLGAMLAPRFVPETATADRLLQEMRVGQYKLAIAIDEFGGTAGVVTLTDLLQAIVGEIRDEYGEEPPAIEKLADGVVRLSGILSVREANQQLGLGLSEDRQTTIAGFVTHQLGRLAREGDVVSVESGELEVLEIEGRRIERLLYYPAASGMERRAGQRPGGGASEK